MNKIYMKRYNYKKVMLNSKELLLVMYKKQPILFLSLMLNLLFIFIYLYF